MRLHQSFIDRVGGGESRWKRLLTLGSNGNSFENLLTRALLQRIARALETIAVPFLYWNTVGYLQYHLYIPIYQGKGNC